MFRPVVFFQIVLVRVAYETFLTLTSITGLFRRMLVSATFGAYPALMFGDHMIMEDLMKSITWLAPLCMSTREGAGSSVVLLMTCGTLRSLIRIPQRRVKLELVQGPVDEPGVSVDNIMSIVSTIHFQSKRTRSLHLDENYFRLGGQYILAGDDQCRLVL